MGGEYQRIDSHGIAKNGGNTIDFLTFYEKMTYAEAMKYILGYSPVTQPHQPQPQEPTLHQPVKQQKQQWWIPSDDHRRTIAYMVQRRKISYGIIKAVIAAGRLGEAVNPQGIHNAVFPFFARYSGGIELSGCEFVGLSDKRYKQQAAGSRGCWSYAPDGEANNVYCFESSIDALSYYDLYKPKHAVLVSLSGVKPTFVPKNTDRPVFICTDADPAGDKLAAQFPQHTRIRPVGGKDWNEILMKK